MRLVLELAVNAEASADLCNPHGRALISPILGEDGDHRVASPLALVLTVRVFFRSLPAVNPYAENSELSRKSSLDQASNQLLPDVISFRPRDWQEPLACCALVLSGHVFDERPRDGFVTITIFFSLAFVEYSQK